MGFFKKVFGDAADELKKSFEESKNDMRKSLEDMKRSAMADFGSRTSSKRADDDDDDDEPRIILGKFSNGVLDIRDDIEELDDESLEDYKNVKMIIFPRGLKKLGSDVICDQSKLEELDFSFVTELKEIPDDFISGTTKIKEFIVPQGVKKLGDGFVGDCKAGTKIVVPSTVEKMGYINGESNNDLLVYLFAPKLNIEDAEEDIKTLYVLPEYYGYYAKKLKEYDSEARLREMPEDMMNIYANSFASALAEKPTEKPAKKSKKKDAAKTEGPIGPTPLDELVQQIKEQLQSVGLTSFVLYGSDYEGDKEYEEIEQLADEGKLESSSEYNLFAYDEDDGNTSVYGKLRKISIVNDVVSFNIEEEYEDENGNIEIRGKYDNQTIGKILRDWDNDAVENGLTNILNNYLTDKTLIELNGGTEAKAVTTEPTPKPQPAPEPKPVPEPQTAIVSQPVNSAFKGLFSERLEALISSALQDGVLTDQEIAVLKKRAEKEDEDWDEVEMIINSRLAEIQKAKGIQISEPHDVQVNRKKPMELNDIKRALLFLSFKSCEGADYAFLYLIDNNKLYNTSENLDTPQIPYCDYFEDLDDWDCMIESISDEYQSFKQLSESLVDEFTDARLEEFEGDRSALAIDRKYTVTVFVGDEKVYEETIICR